MKQEITPPELWLKQRSLDNSIISHPHAGDQYVQCVSDVMREYVEYVVNISRLNDTQDIQSHSTKQ